MEKSATLKRLFNEYTKKYIKKIAIAVFFSLLVAASTSSIAWLLDPAIDKIFIQKDQSLLKKRILNQHFQLLILLKAV